MHLNTRKLKQLRNDKVLAITDLAAIADVSKNTISKAERGGNINPLTIRKLAAALGIEATDLVKS